jgi:hypothetical protein
VGGGGGKSREGGREGPAPFLGGNPDGVPRLLLDHVLHPLVQLLRGVALITGNNVKGTKASDFL